MTEEQTEGTIRSYFDTSPTLKDIVTAIDQIQVASHLPVTEENLQQFDTAFRQLIHALNKAGEVSQEAERQKDLEEVLQSLTDDESGEALPDDDSEEDGCCGTCSECQHK